VLGGSEVIEADFSLGLLFEDPVVSEFSAKIQRWPRDIDLRKGLLSGRWEDFKWMVSCRDACILDKEGGGLTASDFLKACSDMEEAEDAAVRWAIVLNEGGRLAIQLQGLPASAAMLKGKPSLKRLVLTYQQIQRSEIPKAKTTPRKNFHCSNLLRQIARVTTASLLAGTG
jgi:hypothetical protein